MSKVKIVDEGGKRRLYINDMEVTGLVSYAISAGNGQSAMITVSLLAEEVKIL